jgi:hypothetical protein
MGDDASVVRLHAVTPVNQIVTRRTYGGVGPSCRGSPLASRTTGGYPDRLMNSSDAPTPGTPPVPPRPSLGDTVVETLVVAVVAAVCGVLADRLFGDIVGGVIGGLVGGGSTLWFVRRRTRARSVPVAPPNA